MASVAIFAEKEELYKIAYYKYFAPSTPVV
jgi:hypothetical protein